MTSLSGRHLHYNWTINCGHFTCARRDLMPTLYEGGCLCGAIRFAADAPAANPHHCSCRWCQQHTGALTATWVEFARNQVRWTGPGGAPDTWRSSDCSSRAFCRRCGSSLGAIDDAPTVALLLGCFDQPDSPGLEAVFHAFEDCCPVWNGPLPLTDK
ncbi:GFA family protein [Pseudomonas sp.]|uniref:GFA family protein n=1 Tax=Pseudomonas sp. TaxID=306 RepID=UPI0039170B44